MKYSAQKVVRQEILWVPSSRLVEVNFTRDNRPFRVWSLHENDPSKKPELPFNPVHHHNAFLEDYVHDWNIVNIGGKKMLKYYSRVALDNIWILLEFTS